MGQSCFRWCRALGLKGCSGPFCFNRTKMGTLHGITRELAGAHLREGMGWASIATSLLMLLAVCKPATRDADLHQLYCSVWGSTAPSVPGATCTRWSNVSLRQQLYKVGCDLQLVKHISGCSCCLKSLHFWPAGNKKGGDSSVN